MTDDEQEICYEDHEMLEEVDPNKSTNLIIIENHVEEQKPKKKNYKEIYKQTFCPRWQIEFPWLRPNRADNSVGYCNICRKELVCKKSHLERHQRSFKHTRLQGFENVYTVNEPEAELIGAHTSGYLDNDNDQDDDYHVENLYEDVEDGYTTIKVEPTKTSSNSPVIVRKKLEANISPKKRPKHEALKNAKTEADLSYRSIDRDHEQQDMSDFYYATPPQPKKDSFDLFFESISATVKTLPPKLGAEVKSKVSQVIAEFELRAICEQEAQEKSQSMVSIPRQVANIVTVNPSGASGSSANVIHPESVDGTAVTYVYAYQPKNQ